MMMKNTEYWLGGLLVSMEENWLDTSGTGTGEYGWTLLLAYLYEKILIKLWTFVVSET